MKRGGVKGNKNVRIVERSSSPLKEKRGQTKKDRRITREKRTLLPFGRGDRVCESMELD